MQLNAIYLLLTSFDRSLNWSWSYEVKHWIMSHVPSAGMSNLGQKGLSACGRNITFYIIIEVTEPWDAFCNNKLIYNRERSRDGHGERAADTANFVRSAANLFASYSSLSLPVSMYQSGRWISMLPVWEVSFVLPDGQMWLWMAEEWQNSQ